MFSDCRSSLYRRVRWSVVGARESGGVSCCFLIKMDGTPLRLSVRRTRELARNDERNGSLASLWRTSVAGEKGPYQFGKARDESGPFFTDRMPAHPAASGNP